MIAAHKFEPSIGNYETTIGVRLNAIDAAQSGTLAPPVSRAPVTPTRYGAC
jgi:hypothetical protein